MFKEFIYIGFGVVAAIGEKVEEKLKKLEEKRKDQIEGTNTKNSIEAVISKFAKMIQAVNLCKSLHLKYWRRQKICRLNYQVTLFIS
ncbi:MAG: hypothetical protein IE890_07300 [Arcobacter sp.]|nr:hypothetical protein [Arcobacter sp.]